MTTANTQRSTYFRKFGGDLRFLKFHAMSHILHSLMLFAATVLLPAHEPPPVAGEKYCNTRFSFCVEYPGIVLTQKHISENNDGVAVMSADGDVQLRVYGYFNVMGWSVTEEYKDFLEVTRSNNGGEVKELESGFKEHQFDVLLQVGKKLHYERTALKGNHFVSMTLEVNRRGARSIEDSRVQVKQLLDEIVLTVN
jgi:hypothetical protein